MAFSMLYAKFGKSVSMSQALWLRWLWALPLLNLSSRVIWPNKASIWPFQLYYVWNNCLLSPPYCVAVETDEHLTAVGWGCHDNISNLHPCAYGECFFFFLTHFTLWLLHNTLSSPRQQGDGMILTPGSPPDNEFSQTRKSLKPALIVSPVV